MIAGQFPGLFSFAEMAAMDYRDLMFWATEANRKMIAGRMERNNAALLPYQTADTIRDEMNGLANRMAHIDHDESEVERVEAENADLIKAARERAARHRNRGGKGSPRKSAFKRVKTAFPGMIRKGKAV